MRAGSELRQIRAMYERALRLYGYDSPQERAAQDCLAVAVGSHAVSRRELRRRAQGHAA